MRALLLAAGLGTRLRPLTNTIPKCLVPIHGRPLLDYWFDLLFNAGFERVLVNTHYFADAVAAHVHAGPYAERVDLTYEPELLGTGGTVLANADYFCGESFLLAHADNLTDFDVRRLLAEHSAKPPGCVLTMLAFRTDDPRSCGILELDERSVVQCFHEKVEDPPGDLANAAVYVVDPPVVDFIRSIGCPVVDLSTEVMPHLLGRIFAVEHVGYHRDIGTMEALSKAQREFPAP
ncbi:MAG: NTP transferase domain-containing protein [Alphaproteobacteria bacterium]|nr:NTP transferase domain-containing protein [Alphaproteobacteria bacterium]